MNAGETRTFTLALPEDRAVQASARIFNVPEGAVSMTMSHALSGKVNQSAWSAEFGDAGLPVENVFDGLYTGEVLEITVTAHQDFTSELTVELYG